MNRVTLLNPPAPERVSRDYYCGHVTKGDYYWPQIDMLVLSGHLNDHRRIDQFAPQIVVAMTAAISWSSDIEFLADLKRRHNLKVLATGDFPRAVPQQVRVDRRSHDRVDTFADDKVGSHDGHGNAPRRSRKR